MKSWIARLIGLVLVGMTAFSVSPTNNGAQAATWYKATECRHVSADPYMPGLGDYWDFNGCITYEFTNVGGRPENQGIRNVSAKFWGHVTKTGGLAGWEYIPGDLQKVRLSGTSPEGYDWVQIRGIGHFRACLLKVGCVTNSYPWISLRAWAGGGVTWSAGA